MAQFIPFVMFALAICSIGVFTVVAASKEDQTFVAIVLVSMFLAIMAVTNLV